MFKVAIGRAPITVDGQGRRGVRSTARPVYNANPFRSASLPIAALALLPAAALGQTLNAPSGTPNFLSLSAGAPQGTALPSSGQIIANTTIGSLARPGALAFNTYFGDSTKAWFTGYKWGFGYQQTVSSDPLGVPGVLTVQKNASYTGTTGGNPAALVVNNTVGSGVTGNENGMTMTVNVSAASGIFTAIQPTINNLTPGNAIIFGGNTVVTDKTGRKSTVAGAIVGHEFDVIAAGPDDGNDRINLDLIGREYPGGSSDGATTITVAGARVRGQTVQGGAPGVINTPSTSIYGFRTQTMADTGSIGQIMGFQTAFGADGASTAAFSAASAVQTQVTNASALAGATTLKLATTNDKLTAYVWPGALVTGTNIAANTHVTTQAYDNNVTVTITIDTPTSGPIANGATLTFTNKIQAGFVASGYIPGNAFQSTNFSVDGTTGAIVAAGLPTSAPGTHCALWVNAGVVTRTTCP